LHACYLLFIMCLCMSVKSSTELMLYVVLTMPTLNKAYLLFIYKAGTSIFYKAGICVRPHQLRPNQLRPNLP
jgi:hypothetical protein